MLDLLETYVPHVMLLIAFTIFFCFLFLSSITAIAHEAQILFQEVKKSNIVYGSAIVPTPTQLGSLLPLFNITPTPTSIPLPPPEVVPDEAVPINSSFPLIDPSRESVWEKLAQCESGNHWNDNTGNGFYGGLQFTLGTWVGVGGLGSPANASKEEQIYRAKILENRRGFEPWPACGKKLGLL